MSDNTQTNALALINPETFTELITGAPEVLERNRTSVQRANEAGQTILDTIEGSGMSDELDLAANNYQLKIKKTYDDMQGRRKPITQILDEVKKAFTTLEANIDPKNPSSMFAKVQTYRDSWAQKKKDDERKAEQERIRKINLEKEKNEVRAKAEVLISNSFNAFLTQKLNEMSRLLNDATLQTIDTNAEMIINFPEQYPEDHFNRISIPVIASGIPVSLVTMEDVAGIVAEVKEAKKDSFIQQYTLDIQSHKESLSLNIQARREELQAAEQARIAAEQAAEQARIAAQQAAKDAAAKAEAERLQKLADEAAAEQKRLADEKKQREDNEAKRLAEEAAQREEAAKKEAEATKETANMQTLFDASADAAEANAAGVKEAYEIQVTNPSAYLLIAQFWMEKEGMKLTADEIEKKTFKQMKTFCEKHALKTEEKIKSQYIIYKEVAKAKLQR